ncbi:shikimate kinase [Paenibacillus spongiae]|uniref:Shikimate kinase n=1 Tax=Paenibacillus spongiae TaxID=2909671 RepID=A0ABY5S4T5_9BACL|nr:shikimate kinase [Paenibacillus spongiae]UVI27882.1 shikimate kinase [Paenibacillus spongiae]
MNEKKRKAHIVLVGFMGTGKSTVCQLLAKRLGYDAVDMDAEIERREGRRIKDIFAEEGEAAFRKAETEALFEILARPDVQIVATGGGAVLAEHNCEAMLKDGYVIALTADAAHIIARVANDTARPLLQGNAAAAVNRLLHERKRAYDFAHLTIDTTDLTPQQVADRIGEGWLQLG